LLPQDSDSTGEVEPRRRRSTGNSTQQATCSLKTALGSAYARFCISEGTQSKPTLFRVMQPNEDPDNPPMDSTQSTPTRPTFTGDTHLRSPTSTIYGAQFPGNRTSGNSQIAASESHQPPHDVNAVVYAPVFVPPLESEAAGGQETGQTPVLTSSTSTPSKRLSSETNFESVTPNKQRRESHVLSNEDIQEGPQVCVVCGDEASGIHYHALTCDSCKNFFWRSMQKKVEFMCDNDGQCFVGDKQSRSRCQKCRFDRCIESGMKKDWLSITERRLANRARRLTEMAMAAAEVAAAAAAEVTAATEGRFSSSRSETAAAYPNYPQPAANQAPLPLLPPPPPLPPPPQTLPPLHSIQPRVAAAAHPVTAAELHSYPTHSFANTETTLFTSPVDAIPQSSPPPHLSCGNLGFDDAGRPQVHQHQNFFLPGQYAPAPQQLPIPSTSNVLSVPECQVLSADFFSITSLEGGGESTETMQPQSASGEHSHVESTFISDVVGSAKNIAKAYQPVNVPNSLSDFELEPQDQHCLLCGAIMEILTLRAAHTLSLVLRGRCDEVMKNKDWFTIQTIESKAYPEIGVSSDSCSSLIRSIAFEFCELHVDDVEVAMLAALLITNPYRSGLRHTNRVFCVMNVLTAIFGGYAIRRRCSQQLEGTLKELRKRMPIIKMQIELIASEDVVAFKNTRFTSVRNMSLYLHELIAANDEEEEEEEVEWDDQNGLFGAYQSIEAHPRPTNDTNTPFA
uniref:Nuclear receptor domain-containing protein n=1 Tax=Mesocestoides corti TaxID=53468 RepID=A0A5K3FVQ9_MESCO